MFRWGATMLGVTSFMFAVFSSSSTYQLKSYSIGPGGTNNSASSTYKLQGSVGEQTNNSTSSSTYKANNSSIQTEQLNVPLAPTLSNGSGAYYNQLNCIVSAANDPSDSTYAIAISTDNFVTTNYVQADGTIGASPVYQTYSAWGGATGFQVIGLTSNTTYKTKAAAKEGLFSNTAYSTTPSSATTATPTLSFSVSPNSASMGSFLPNTVTASSNISFAFATNGASGGSIYVRGANSGFKSTSKSFTISAVSGDLSSLSQGFGIQATNPNQTSGGPLTKVTPYNGAGNIVGAEATTFAQMLTTSAAIVGGTATANVQVKAPGNAPPAADYNEVFTFIASASF